MRRWRSGVGLAVLLSLVAISGAAPSAAAPAAAAPTAADLDALRDTLIRSAPPGSAAWIDPATGRVELRLAGAAPAALSTMLAGNAARVRVKASAPVVDLDNLYGGHGIEGSFGVKMHCTSGFIASNGTASFVITAGHCTTTSTKWERKGNYLGERYLHSVYGPDGDFGVIQEKGVTFQAQPGVNVPAGVVWMWGVRTAEVGQYLCKMGNTSKLSCGYVTAVDVSVAKTDFVMEGMIRTSICAEKGDSGGPLMTPYESDLTLHAYAIGITANGNNDCSSPEPVTHFQPLPEILDWFGLTLATP